MLNNYKENLIYINKRVKMKVLRKMYKQKKGRKMVRHTELYVQIV